MQSNLITFGKDGYLITENTLALIEKTLAKKTLPIGLFRPVKNRHDDDLRFSKYFKEFKPNETIGEVTNLDFTIVPNNLFITGNIKPTGRRKDILEIAIDVLEEDFSLIPRMTTKVTSKGISVVEIYGFDLFLEEKDVPTLLTKHSLKKRS